MFRCGIMSLQPSLDSGLHVPPWVRHLCFRIFAYFKDLLHHIHDSFTDLLVSVVLFLLSFSQWLSSSHGAVFRVNP